VAGIARSRLESLTLSEAPPLVVVDEAQNLEDEVLETLRLLSNFETSKAKLMHIILAGQPALAQKLAGPRLTQLRQRVSIVQGLAPLSHGEVKNYVPVTTEMLRNPPSKRQPFRITASRLFSRIANKTSG
jgi:type II secretory pathway predicted ATPase ExeA